MDPALASASALGYSRFSTNPDKTLCWTTPVGGCNLMDALVCVDCSFRDLEEPQMQMSLEGHRNDAMHLGSELQSCEKRTSPAFLDDEHLLEEPY